MFHLPKSIACTRGAAVLRRQEPSDSPFIGALFRANVAVTLAASGLPQSQIEALAGMQLRARDLSYSRTFPDAVGLIAVLEDRPAGRILVAETPGALHVVDLAVDPAARRGGIGRGMVQAVMEEAGEGGLGVTAEAMITNLASLALFDGLGFRRAGEAGGSIGLAWRS